MLLIDYAYGYIIIKTGSTEVKMKIQRETTDFSTSGPIRFTGDYDNIGKHISNDLESPE